MQENRSCVFLAGLHKVHRAIFDQARHNIGEQQRMMVRDLKFLLEDNRDYTVSVFVPRTKSHS